MGMSVIGIVIGFFLKHLNVVCKSISSALQMVFTTLLSALLFGIPFDFLTLLSTLTVCVGVVLYALHSAPAPSAEREVTKLETVEPAGAVHGKQLDEFDLAEDEALHEEEEDLLLT